VGLLKKPGEGKLLCRSQFEGGWQRKGQGVCKGEENYWTGGDCDPKGVISANTKLGGGKEDFSEGKVSGLCGGIKCQAKTSKTGGGAKKTEKGHRYLMNY